MKRNLLQKDHSGLWLNSSREHRRKQESKLKGYQGSQSKRGWGLLGLGYILWREEDLMISKWVVRGKRRFKIASRFLP